MKIAIPITLLAVSFGVAAQDPPSFARVIQPILSNNCYGCHGPDANAREADLRLDVEESARRVLGGDDGAEILDRITTADPNDQMPPPDSGKSLEPDDIAKIRAWVDAGAPYEQHWAFVKPERPALPAVKQTDWPRNAIDHFILARIEAAGLTPSPEADRVTLLRRVHFDLTGIPPTPDEVEAFVNDKDPGAYDRIVDRLLASKHFGERWGRHWLDVARYADSNGYSIDGERSIWPYRDWVIDAFNSDMPFDQFIIEQMAGDLLPNATREQKVATGFHRNTMINQEGGIDKEEFRIASIIDRVNTIGASMLGLTLGCVQCHSHKYDPIVHEEYYGLMAFMNNDDEPSIELPTEEHIAQRKQIAEEAKAKDAELAAYLDEAQAEAIPAWEKALTLEAIHELDKETRVALASLPEERDDAQRKLVREAFALQDRGARKILNEKKIIEGRAPNVPRTMVLAARAEPRETRLLIQGDYTRPGDPVQPMAPAALHPMPEGAPMNRIGLAQWIVDPNNPLTARVTVNRYWQKFFGRGIVETENDFGMQSIPPTHPELLDWLAVEFVESGWNVKHILRTMVMSAAYRQASIMREDVFNADPRNSLLAQQRRLRLDAEIVRDNALAVSGLLSAKIGGPGVYPPQPDGVMKLGQRERSWNISTGEDRYRRGMYTYFYRGTPHPALTVFDAPNAQFTCTRRVRSNTPLQALTLLNDPAFDEMARALGAAMLQNGDTDVARIDWAFARCLGRQPTDGERTILNELLERERAAVEPGENAEAAVWHAVARTMLNLDEFITRE